MITKFTADPEPDALLTFRAVPVMNLIDTVDRDTTQSSRLHEPTSITSHTDPMTGNDVIGTEHPFVQDGILKVYFESEQSRKNYLATPLNHPVRKISTPASAEDDRGG